MKVSKTSGVTENSGAGPPVFLMEFAIAAPGVLVPRRREHIRDSNVGALILKKRAGTAYLADCKLGERRGQSLMLAWENNRPHPTKGPEGSCVTRTWISLAPPRRDQLSFL
jgi:hypothetical protein